MAVEREVSFLSFFVLSLESLLKMKGDWQSGERRAGFCNPSSFSWQSLGMIASSLGDSLGIQNAIFGLFRGSEQKEKGIPARGKPLSWNTVLD